jgi:hypothetical protein
MSNIGKSMEISSGGGGSGIIYGSDRAPKEITKNLKSICGSRFEHMTI